MINIRSGQKKDFPALWQLAAETRVYLPEMENDIWVAEKQATVVGFIACSFAVDEMNILGLAVSAAERQQGVAYRLHQTALHKLKPRFSFLEVRESNLPAQSLYQKLGYQAVGVRKNYYRSPSGQFENAIVMRWEKVLA